MRRILSIENDIHTVYCLDKPKARKEHTCGECRGTIFVGEVYHKHHGVWDGEAYTFKVCEDCDALRAVLDADVHDEEERTAFTCLCESVFESGDAHIMATFLEIKEKRNALVPQWMKDRVDDAVNETDEKAECAANEELDLITS